MTNLTLDTLEDTHVLLDGETVPAGVAVQRMRQAWGTNWTVVGISEAGYTIANRCAPETVTLPVVPPTARTSAARGNASRRAAIARAARGATREGQG